MMKLENQVCLFEQAKTFKDEFGLELKSYFVWVYCPTLKKWQLRIKEIFDIGSDEWISAYTCSELGILLPHKIKGKFEPVFRPEEAVEGEFEYTQEGKDYYGCFRWGYHRFTDRYHDDSYWLVGSILSCETHGKADILIQCLREGYIKPEDLKL